MHRLTLAPFARRKSSVARCNASSGRTLSGNGSSARAKPGATARPAGGNGSRRRVHASACARVATRSAEPTPRTRAVGSRPVPRPTARSLGGAFRRRRVPAAPKCPGRSTRVPVLPQVAHQLLGRHRGLGRWNVPARMTRRRAQTLTDQFGEHGIADGAAAVGARGRDLRDHPIAVGHQDRLTARSESDVLAELVLSTP